MPENRPLLAGADRPEPGSNRSRSPTAGSRRRVTGGGVGHRLDDLVVGRHAAGIVLGPRQAARLDAGVVEGGGQQDHVGAARAEDVDRLVEPVVKYESNDGSPMLVQVESTSWSSTSLRAM